VTLSAVFGSPAVAAATDDGAWVAAMLEAEVALARACAEAGLIPAETADAIAEAGRPGLVDPAEIWRSAATSATPVIALVDALRAAVPADHRAYVHYGATSQDIVDTAMMLVAVRSVAAIDADLSAVAARLAQLAAAHAGTPQRGRTLMRPARPTTFGAVCGAWLAAVTAATEGLRRWRPAVQLGGAVGDRSAFDGGGPNDPAHPLAAGGERVAAAMATNLGLDPAPPWHTDRTRVVELGAALGIVAGTLAKLAGDVILLSQAEIGELGETTAGGSSAMPEKRNPARAVLVVACAHRVPGLVSTLLAGMPQELQRAAGRWQAEWPTLTDLLRVVAGAAYHARAMLDDLTVDAERMASRA
jgi:3-carboxy-cis,cis-muconate cycloisomerase